MIHCCNLTWPALRYLHAHPFNTRTRFSYDTNTLHIEDVPFISTFSPSHNDQPSSHLVTSSSCLVLLDPTFRHTPQDTALTLREAASTHSLDHMQADSYGSAWDLSPVIDLIHSLASSKPKEPELAYFSDRGSATSSGQASPSDEGESQDTNDSPPPSLGDFDAVWKYLGKSPEGQIPDLVAQAPDAEVTTQGKLRTIDGFPTLIPIKGVHWQDGVGQSDVEIDESLATPKPSKRAERASAKAAREDKLRDAIQASKNAKKEIRKKGKNLSKSSKSDSEADSDTLSAKKPIDRRAILSEYVHGSDGPPVTVTPKPKYTASPATPKTWPVSNPQLWQPFAYPSPSTQRISPLISESVEQRRLRLLRTLLQRFPDESRLLSSPGLIDPAFIKINKAETGVHVFIDASNVCALLYRTPRTLC